MSERSRLIELKRELEWRRSAKSCAYFLENHYKIRHPAQGMIPFKLRQAQKDGLEHWQSNRYSLTLKARQIGWSTLVAGYSTWQAIFQADRHIIMISRTEREAIALLQKAKYGFKHLPKWMQERAPEQLVDHQQKMEFDNGSKILSMPSATDPARGESASTIIVDEWAFLPNAEESWASIEPVADVGGTIIGLSTANGSGNFFHHLWTGSQNGTNQFKGYFAPWSANTDRDQDWYDAKSKTTLPWILAQEYPSNAEEAFIKSGRMVFDLKDLLKVQPEEPQRGHIHQISSMRDIQWRPDSSPTTEEPLRVWKEPEANATYVIGADIAEGLEWGDYSSAHVINASTGLVVAMWHGRVPADIFAEELYTLGTWYNSALIGPEANNHGLTTITGLRRLGYQRLYRRRRLNSAKGKTPQLEFGWMTSRTTKPLMIDELAMAIRNEDIELRCAETLAELKTYVRDDKGQMGGSPHDDRVVSLAIANQMLSHAFNPEYRPVHDNYLTLDWWASLESGGEPKSSNWVIGKHAVRH